MSRRESFGAASNSSSESDTGSSSDSDGEENFKSVNSLKVSHPTSDATAIRDQEDAQTHSAPGINFKRSMHSETEEKVWNSRNTKQEKENCCIQNRIEQKISSTISKTSIMDSIPNVEDNKKLILRKLKVLNKSYGVADKKRGQNKDCCKATSSPLTSDDGDTSSGGQEVRRIISNDAVARRHQANLARLQLVKEKDRQLREKERPR